MKSLGCDFSSTSKVTSSKLCILHDGTVGHSKVDLVTLEVGG